VSRRSRRARVAVLQPYVPRYRVALFEALEEALADDGIDLTVAAPAPRGVTRERADAVTTLAVPLRAASVRLGRRRVVLRDPRAVVAHADLVVTEQTRRDVDTYLLLAAGRALPAGPARVALWGHGPTTTRAVTGWEGRLLDRLTARADWFFAYTHAGAAHAVAAGMPAERVSVTANTLDTDALAAADAAADPGTGARARQRWKVAGPAVATVGALDASKRPALLLAAGDLLAERLPGFTWLVGGEGPARADLATVDAPWLRLLGPVDAAGKVELARATGVWAQPGRVGLVAVDALALGCPLVTTRYPFHAPEVAYLRDGHTTVVTADEPAAFADAIAALLTDPVRRAAMAQQCRADAAAHTLEASVAAFAAGIRAALDAPPRRAAA